MYNAELLIHATYMALLELLVGYDLDFRLHECPVDTVQCPSCCRPIQCMFLFSTCIHAESWAGWNGDIPVQAIAYRSVSCHLMSQLIRPYRKMRIPQVSFANGCGIYTAKCAHISKIYMCHSLELRSHWILTRFDIRCVKNRSMHYTQTVSAVALKIRDIFF